jgi:sulfoxide reductase heme-binding subunit YedZ
MLYLLVWDGYGGRVLNGLVHESGKWAVRLTVVALAMTPVAMALRWPRLGLVRRIVGVSAAAYALAHLGLYVADQGFALGVVVSEIVKRVYLTIGFIALVGLAALAATSLDSAMRRMGAWWKRLHRLVYPVVALALLHFFMQTKANQFEPTLVAGLALWLLLWRLLPERARGKLWVYPLLALAAGLGTVGIEYAWYSLATSVNPERVLAANWTLRFGLRPAHWVTIAALAGAAIVAGRRAMLAGWLMPRRAAGAVAAVRPPRP